MSLSLVGSATGHLGDYRPLYALNLLCYMVITYYILMTDLA